MNFLKFIFAFISTIKYEFTFARNDSFFFTKSTIFMNIFFLKQNYVNYVCLRVFPIQGVKINFDS